jgi:hypothetical protein
MVMIGDHKQLRPKLENHKLTVACGEGHDFNRSLFERLAGAILRTCTRTTLNRRAESARVYEHSLSL